MKTGFVYDERFLEHQPGPQHPERPARLEATIEHLRAQAWYDDLTQLDALLVDPSVVENTHSAEYIRRARETCASGASFLDVADVGVSEESYDVALLAAGGLIELVDRTAHKQIDNGFMLSRPPGHHAEREMALGFCLFNNIAIAARHLQKEHQIDKVLILDWDVHHGNGTQHSFEQDPSVMYVSTHQYPYYPGTGAASETGIGQGSGATVNCPMPAGADDQMYEAAFVSKILPAIDAFAPDFILLSAGFDAHHADPLAAVNLSTEFFGWMTQRMLEVADKHAQGRLVSMLEGGYNIDYLPQCVALHVEHLLHPTSAEP